MGVSLHPRQLSSAWLLMMPCFQAGNGSLGCKVPFAWEQSVCCLEANYCLLGSRDARLWGLFALRKADGFVQERMFPEDGVNACVSLLGVHATSHFSRKVGSRNRPCRLADIGIATFSRESSDPLGDFGMPALECRANCWGVGLSQTDRAHAS